MMLHEVACDKRAGAAETGFAMDCDGAVGPFADGEEFVHDALRRRRSVGEVKIVMRETGVGESTALVSDGVETHHRFDADGPEVVEIRFRRVVMITSLDAGASVRTAKGEQFPGKNPIGVAVLDLLAQLVVGHVEGSGVVESAADGALEALQHVEEAQIVRGASDGRVAEGEQRTESCGVGAEAVIVVVGAAKRTVFAPRFGGDEMMRFEGSHAEIEDSVGGDEKGSVGPLLLIHTRNVNDFLLG